MPTYHYRCEACGSTAERQMTISSKEKPDCEQCGKPMQKVIVPPMVHFKGAGFYKTDSSKAPAPKKEADTPKKADKPAAPPPPPAA